MVSAVLGDIWKSWYINLILVVSVHDYWCVFVLDNVLRDDDDSDSFDSESDSEIRIKERISASTTDAKNEVISGTVE